MKKLLVLGAVALFGLSNAQTEKGSWVIGGSTTLGFNNVNTKVKYNGNSVDGPKVSTFNITPSVGYFVANNIAVGLDLGYTSMTTKQTVLGTEYKTTNSIFKVMPTATYYFKTGDSKLLPYLGAGIGYASNTEKEDNHSYTYDGLAWKVKGGITYLVTPQVGIDLGLAYDQFSNKDNNVTTNVNTFGVNAGFSFFFK